MMTSKKIHDYQTEINGSTTLSIKACRDSDCYIYYTEKSVKISLFIESENEFFLLGTENTIFEAASFKNLSLTKLGETKFKIMGDHIYERIFVINGKGYLKIVPLTEYVRIM